MLRVGGARFDWGHAPFHWAQAATSAPHDPVTLATDAVVLGAALGYGWGVLRLRRRGRRWSRWSTAAFVAGLAAIFVAVGSGLAEDDDVNFTVHMVQHSLLMWLAPVLLAFGRPLTLVIQASPRRLQVPVVRLASSRGASLLVGWPVWLVSYATMPVYLLTPLYGLSLRDQTVHDLVHAWFLTVGFLFWQGVLGLDPVRRRHSHLWRMAGLAAGMPIKSGLGVVLMATPARLVQDVSLGATHAGGQVLWMTTMVASGIGMVTLLAQWAVADERRGRRHDRRAGVELQLDQLADARAQLRRLAGGTAEAGPAVQAPLAGEVPVALAGPLAGEVLAGAEAPLAVDELDEERLAGDEEDDERAPWSRWAPSTGA